jgi:hypothetical protein
MGTQRSPSLASWMLSRKRRNTSYHSSHLDDQLIKLTKILSAATERTTDRYQLSRTSYLSISTFGNIMTIKQSHKAEINKGVVYVLKMAAAIHEHQ